MKINENNIVTVWLRARALAEATHIVTFDRPGSEGYKGRMEKAEEALSSLLEILGDKK